MVLDRTKYQGSLGEDPMSHGQFGQDQMLTGALSKYPPHPMSLDPAGAASTASGPNQHCPKRVSKPGSDYFTNPGLYWFPP